MSIIPYTNPNPNPHLAHADLYGHRSHNPRIRRTTLKPLPQHLNLALLQRRGFGAMPHNSKACQAAVRRLGLLAGSVSWLVQHVATTQYDLFRRRVSTKATEEL